MVTVMAGFMCIATFITSPSAHAGSNCHFRRRFIPSFQRMDYDVERMSLEDIIDYFRWSNSSSCSLSQDFGGELVSTDSGFRGFDGQKAVCLHPARLPVPDPDSDIRRCLVYSFGINDEWSFDDAMDRYGCRVFAFDPSMNSSDHNRTDHIHFFRTGLGADDDGRSHWTDETLKEIYDDLVRRMWHGSDDIIDYLKMDIEWAEWSVLPHILQSGMMDKVRQLAVEIHLPFRPPHFYGGQQLDQFRRLARILMAIEDYGLVRFDSKPNLLFQDTIEELNYTGPMAYELAWYNNRFL